MANPVTIINDKGELNQGATVVKLDNGRLGITMPANREESARSFHVIFRNRHEHWKSFTTTNLGESLDLISVMIPEKVHYWQKRRYKRVSPPHGCKAVVRDINKSLVFVQIRDLSVGGMLLYNENSEKIFSVGTYVNELLVFINQSRDKEEKEIPRKILPIIDHGRVVRSLPP